ncbi:hypothetical protein EVAR_103210_1 [Eumeta japonica]|uniref:Uncharacterized protein n=1 Tax=Eumeta variegata TaxID=151549 RepID=A0A4C2A3D5_EUMVA|nr:hypothetical protein EVAR_103210_1 [Eumeta japonica]
MNYPTERSLCACPIPKTAFNGASARNKSPGGRMHAAHLISGIRRRAGLRSSSKAAAATLIIFDVHENTYIQSNDGRWRNYRTVPDLLLLYYIRDSSGVPAATIENFSPATKGKFPYFQDSGRPTWDVGADAARQICFMF